MNIISFIFSMIAAAIVGIVSAEYKVPILLAMLISLLFGIAVILNK